MKKRRLTLAVAHDHGAVIHPVAAEHIQHGALANAKNDFRREVGAVAGGRVVTLGPVEGVRRERDYSMVAS